MIPNFKEEKKLWKGGYKFVACLDESGVGPLAGPVVAGVAAIKKINNLTIKQFNNLGIKDSKKLSPKKRGEFYKILTRHPHVLWAVAGVPPKIIDKINIFEATKLAMAKAVKNLNCKLQNINRLKSYEVKPRKIGFLILDGKMKIDLPIPQKSIIKADEKVFSCAAASIIAKVTRDRMMARCHKKYPKYRFDLHKGYPTLFHRAMIKKYGFCSIHRKSFKPALKNC